MNSDLLATILTTGTAVAFFHAAIPTHWLPFVLAGKAQSWSRSRTLSVTALAGGGHVLFTIVLGAFVVGFGAVLDRWIGSVFPYLAGTVLILLGLFYLVRQFGGIGHGHTHFADRHSHGDHEHPHTHPHSSQHAHPGPHPHGTAVPQLAPRAETLELPSHETVALPERTSDRAAVLALLAALTFSPCEGFLPVFLSGVPFGWAGFALLAATLAVATLTGMLAFTWLTLVGLERVKLDILERFEQGALGALLCVLGVIVLVFER